MTEQVVKIKDLRRQTKEWMAVFSQTVWEYYRKSCVSICVIIPQNRKVKKKFQLHIIDQSFEHNGMGISYQKKLESLEEKKAVHTSCKHGVRRIFHLYTKGGPAGKLMWCETSRDHLDYRRRDRLEHTKIQPPKHRTIYDSDYASPGRMWLWTRFGSSYILYLTS